MDNVPVQSVRKAFDLLSILAFEDPQQHGIALGKLAERAGLSPATTRNLLKSILPSGFVAQKPDSRYVLGPNALQMTALHRLSTEPARGVVLQAMREASDRLQETVVLAVLANGRRRQLYAVDTDQPIRVDETVVEERSIYDTATGRLLTAYASPEELAQLMQRWGLPGEMWGDTTDDSAFTALLASVRGNASLIIYPGGGEITAIACPVQSEEGKLLAAIGCHAPTYRCPTEKQQQIVDELHKTARELAKALQPIL